MLYAMVPYKQTQESKRKACIFKSQVFHQIDTLHNNINSGDADSFCFLFYRSLRCKVDEVNVYCNCYHIKYIMLHKKSTMISLFIKLKKKSCHDTKYECGLWTSVFPQYEIVLSTHCFLVFDIMNFYK